MTAGEGRRVAWIALAATYLFFIEYLPPFKRVHIPYDLEGFHYPLLNYAAKSLGEGRFPEWDPSTYCGLSFVGNVQAGLFYPPNWILLTVGAARGGLPFKALEIVVLAHVWLAFVLAYGWLRERGLRWEAAASGAAVYGYGGYLMSQMQHYGVVAASAWLPLALWSVDRGWWGRLAGSAALALLAGYPPAWFTFCVITAVYAAATAWRRLGIVAAGLAFSVALAAVQVLPALEAASVKTPENKYGGGIAGAEIYVSFLVPNYFGLGRSQQGEGEPTSQYFYLGAPALFGLPWTLWRRPRGILPAAAVAAVSLVFMTNPGGLVERAAGALPVAGEVCRDWNFLAGLPVAAALVAAVAVDDAWGRIGGRRWWAAAAAAVWCTRLLWVWRPGGADFRTGWGAAVDPAVTLALFVLLVGARPAAAALVLIGVDYKVFGADRRFNAADLDADRFFSDARSSRRLEVHGLESEVYATMLANPAYRVAIDERGLHPTDFRHYRLATPQGFDPLLPAGYKRAVEAFTPFRTDRHFNIDPANSAMLERLAVRYYLTVPPAASNALMAKNPDFRLLGKGESYFRVFEWRKARPAYRWENGEGTAKAAVWIPERRELLVRSEAGGRVVLVEQYFPGWRVAVDGREAALERWGEAFQAVRVGPGEHRIQFQFRSRGLRVGAVISLVALGCLWLFHRRTQSRLAGLASSSSF
jgi:hypothetical protein